MRSIKKLFIMLMILSIYTTTIAMAVPGGNVAPTATSITNVTAIYTPNVTGTQTVTQTVTQTAVTTQPTQSPTTVTTTVGGKFRVGPTVRIRPLNDIISQDQDGLVELYMDNPSLNDIPLSVDARISVPSGIHVYGQSFGEASAAGMVYGKFEVPPGTARTINIVIKAEKIGDFNAQFSGLYWPGENKDAYQPISLTHPFKVTAPSKSPLKDTSEDAGGDKGKQPEKTAKSPGISIIVAISIVVIMVYILRRK